MFVTLLTGVMTLPVFAFEWTAQFSGKDLLEQVPPVVLDGNPANARPAGDDGVAVRAGDGQTVDFRIPMEMYNRDGITVEVVAKVEKAAGNFFVWPGLNVFLIDDYCAENMVIRPGAVVARQALLEASVPDDGDFHTYRLTAKNNDFRIYVDGELVINGPDLYLAGRHELPVYDLKGDNHYRSVTVGAGLRNQRSQGVFREVSICTAGAFAPDGTPERFSGEVMGQRIEIPKNEVITRRMQETLNGWDPEVPQIGGDVEAPVFYDDDQVTIWNQNAGTKVFREDFPLGLEVDPVLKFDLAANEVEATQLVLHPNQAPLKDISWTIGDLTSDSGETIGADNFRVNPVGYIKVMPVPSVTRINSKWVLIGKQGYWPDPLLPLDTFTAEHAINYPIWISLHAPEGTPPGTYRGEMSLSAEGMATRNIQIVAEVFDFEIPMSPSIKASYTFLPHFGSSHVDEDVARGYYEELIRHRGSPSTVWPYPQVELRDGKVIIDREGSKLWEDNARWLIEDKGVNNFFFPYVSPVHHFLEYDEARRRTVTFLGVPMYEDDAETFTEEFKDVFQQYLVVMSEYLEELGWLDKFNHLFSMNEPAVTDVPRRFDIIAEYCDLVHEVRPDLDVSVNMAIIVGPPEIDKLIGKISIWRENAFDTEALEARREDGDQIWFYWNRADFIDSDAMRVRANGWIMWDKQIEGHYFDNLMNRQFNAQGWEVPGQVFLGRQMWGNGQLVYANETLDGFVGSTRWEGLLDGYEDYEYFKLLNDRIQQTLDSPTASPEKKELANEARTYLEHLSDTLVPVYNFTRSAPYTSPRVIVEESDYETDPNVIMEGRERVAQYIQQLGE
ncbi:MAG: DUF4091 domain-containing protein [Verrucomicrobiota bacterium JB024]|nr:DUF4091 domain-containing protein [Verrucomicrobiota bacterium JB024]